MALALALLLPLGWMLFGPRGVAVQVQAKIWRFEIEVEKRVLESGSDWCDALPADARDISRQPRQRADGPPEHCRYSAPQWRRRWGEQLEGEDPQPPRWPQPRLVPLPPDQIGAERLGKRQAHYELQLRAADGRHWSCPVALAQWQRIVKGSSVRIQVDRQGVADCATIPAN
jgi:hypothetical protein